MMRKLLLMLAVASLSVASVAQDSEPVAKYSVSTNSFWSNWFVQANVSWNAFYVGGEHKLLSSPFNKFGLGTKPGEGHPTSLGFSVALGKWFTPGIGLRTKANALWVGKAFDGDSPRYLTLNEHVLFNLSNMFCGYNADRVWNFIPYVGAGWAKNFRSKHGTLLWSAGILNTFRLSRMVALNLELGYMSYGKEFLGLNAGQGGAFGKSRRDHHFTLEVGATINLDKRGWRKSPDVEAIKALSQSQIDALNAQLEDAMAENDRLRQELSAKPVATAAVAEAKPTAPVTKVVAAPVSVFFNIGQATLASKKELQNVADLVKVAKDNKAKIVVTGYADSKTGSSDYNRQLSQKRADAVAAEIVKMGFSRDSIETVAAGGVDTLNPSNYNRRVTIEIK